MLSDWWNGVELWVLGLAFPLQFALVVAVLVPLCLVVAWLIDRIVDHAAAVFGPAHSTVAPIGSQQPADESGESEEDEPVAAEAAEPAPDERVPAESTGHSRS